LNPVINLIKTLETMKKFKFMIMGISFLALLIAGGCEDLLDFTFESDGSDVTFIVEPEEEGEYIESQKILKADLDSIIAAEGKDIGNLKTVYLTEATAEIIGEGNFDAVGSINIKLKAEGLSEITLTSKNNVPIGATSIELDVYNGDLAAYLNSPEYTLTLGILLDEDLVSSMTVKATLKYEITVGL
jgi:hypothetical protein